MPKGYDWPAPATMATANHAGRPSAPEIAYPSRDATGDTGDRYKDPGLSNPRPQDHN
jgi:hypothetical protein